MKKKKNKDITFWEDNQYKKIENGYVVVLCEGKWVREHILVVEKKIGRKLVKGETVHHISGDKQENCIENLMLFPNQKEHKKFENKVRQFGVTNNVLKQINERWKEYGK